MRTLDREAISEILLIVAVIVLATLLWKLYVARWIPPEWVPNPKQIWTL